MAFRIIGRTGPRMRQMVGFGDRVHKRGTFGREFRCKTEIYLQWKNNMKSYGLSNGSNAGDLE